MAYELLVPAIIAGVGGLTSLFGSYLNGKISDKQFDREMSFKERELGATLDLKAQELGLSASKVRQDWTQFMSELKQRKSEFASTMGFNRTKLSTETALTREQMAQQAGQVKETMALQKEDLAHKKFMDIINPILEKTQRAQNIVDGFSAIAQSQQKQVAAPPANPVSAPPPPVATPVNPVIAGV